MDDVTFQFFSRTVDFKCLQSCLVVLDEYRSLKSAKFLIAGNTEPDDLRYRFGDIEAGVCQETYEKFGRLFFEQDDLHGGVSRRDGFEHLTFVFKNLSAEPNALIRLFMTISKLTSADFSFVYGENLRSEKYFNVAHFAHEEGLGLAAGLRDVYWLNFYGKSFTQLIGVENLLELSVFDVSEFEDGVCVRVSEKIEDAYELKDLVKSQVGEEYFVPKRKSTEQVRSGGILRFLGVLWAIVRAPKDLDTAKVRPRFGGE
ncbi:MAG: hypothetical protein AAFX56_09730 [Pseudomonadota bacterium]